MAHGFASLEVQVLGVATDVLAAHDERRATDLFALPALAHQWLA